MVWCGVLCCVVVCRVVRGWHDVSIDVQYLIFLQLIVELEELLAYCIECRCLKIDIGFLRKKMNKKSCLGNTTQHNTTQHNTTQRNAAKMHTFGKCLKLPVMDRGPCGCWVVDGEGAVGRATGCCCCEYEGT